MICELGFLVSELVVGSGDQDFFFKQSIELQIPRC